MRSLLLVLRVIALSILAGILTLAGMSTSDILIAILLYIAAYICVFYIRRASPKKQTLKWREEVILLAIIGLFLFAGWVITAWPFITSSDSIKINKTAPPFDTLYTTTGILKKGAGGDRYLVKTDKKTLRLTLLWQKFDLTIPLGGFP